MAKLIRFRCFGGKDVIETEDIDVSQPDAGEVLVSVRAASVNPVDFKIRSGKYPAVNNDRLPYTLGRDVSGVVEKCGAQATRFKVGAEVFGIAGIHGGGYAEKAVLDQNAITAKPAGLDHVHAAAISLAGQTAWQGLFRYGGLKAGQSALIHGGSGGVGHFAHPVREGQRRTCAHNCLDEKCWVRPRSRRRRRHRLQDAALRGSMRLTRLGV
jgi:NADPH:quinone reductase-like Zn-dependent oxidoreductase